MKRLSFLGAVVTVFSACSHDSPIWKSYVFTTHDQSRSAASADLPRSLWEKITGLIHEGGTSASGGSDGAEQGADGENTSGGSARRLGQLPSVFSPIRVYLVEKNQGILTKGNTEIILPAGGGEIDLSDFVQAKNGSFYFAAEFLPKLEKVERKVFFLSGARERDIQGERFGAGCHTYFDVSSAFNKAVSREGFLVNTTDGRHISALAGTFFFAAAHEGKLYLASLIVKDSVRRKLQCP